MKERLLGFEITTNKGTIKKFGYGEDNCLIKIPELENKDQVVVGFEFCADDKEGVTGLSCFYLSKNRFSTVLHTGIIYLRVKLKNKDFRKKIEGKLKGFSTKMKTLYQACLLPDYQFFEVMKLVIN